MTVTYYKDQSGKMLNRQLFEAATAGDEDKVIELAGKADVNSRHELNATALYMAAKHGHIKIVKILLAIKGIDINAAIENGATALYTAMRNGHSDIFKLLLSVGANTEIKVNDITLKSTAIYLGLIDNIKDLLEAGVELYSDNQPDERSYDPRSLLYLAATYNAEDTVKYNKIYKLVMNHYWKSIPTLHQKFIQNFENNGKTFEVVIVRYNEDLSWVIKEFPNEKVTIYNKGADYLGELPSGAPRSASKLVAESATSEVLT